MLLAAVLLWMLPQYLSKVVQRDIYSFACEPLF